MKKLICIPLALASLGYYLWLGVHNDFQLSVLPFWLLLSLLFLLIALWDRIPLIRRAPKPLIQAAKACLTAGAVFFFAVEGLVLWGMGMEAPRDTELDYLMVLGAGLQGERPSHTLELRLEQALAYAETHPDVRILVSGGINPSAKISEAQAMRAWLLEKGVSPERILTEDRSTTTAENMQFGLPILLNDMDCKDCSVGIVTSDFHVFRSLCLAKQAVRQNAKEETRIRLYGIAADFPSVPLPHYMVREFFTICVDTLRGNMGFRFNAKSL